MKSKYIPISIFVFCAITSSWILYKKSKEENDKIQIPMEVIQSHSHTHHYHDHEELKEKEISRKIASIHDTKETLNAPMNDYESKVAKLYQSRLSKHIVTNVKIVERRDDKTVVLVEHTNTVNGLRNSYNALLDKGKVVKQWNRTYQEGSAYRKANKIELVPHVQL